MKKEAKPQKPRGDGARVLPATDSAARLISETSFSLLFFYGCLETRHFQIVLALIRPKRPCWQRWCTSSSMLLLLLSHRVHTRRLMRPATQRLMPSDSGSTCPYLLKSIQFNSPICRHGNQTFVQDNDLLEQS